MQISVVRKGALAGALLALAAMAPAQNPSSATNPFYGSVTVAPATEATLRLSLDEAIAGGLRNNLGLKESESQEKNLHGQRNEALQMFLPTVTLTGGTGVHQHNLASMGFAPATVQQFAKLLGMSAGTSFSSITRDDLTEGRLDYQQTLFSGPVIAAYKAAGAAVDASHFATADTRSRVVQTVASAYLRAVAAASEVTNAEARVRQAQTLADHAHERHVAGVAANLDELRAKVELQTQQQSLLAAENTYEKSLILLKRTMGVAPGQKIELNDPAPYNELAAETPEAVKTVALSNRPDYKQLQSLAKEYEAIHLAYRLQRLPSLSFSGSYAASRVNGAGTHGNFEAAGSIQVPLFREAKLRGDVDTARAQWASAQASLDDLRGSIDQQVRAALLDVTATQQLVRVARSNVELATRTVSDETDRVNAGVDDNLPLVEAQASLASAENNLVESLYQFNLAKLELAQAAGLLETKYRDYLGR
jgi:outer membrane protein TolC